MALTDARTCKLIAPLLVGVVWGLVLSASVVLAFVLINPWTARGTDAVAAQFDVTVNWFDRDDPTVCANPEGLEYAGCFHYTQPDVINVMRGLTPEQEAHTVLHEIGHVLQNRLGLEPNECDADRFAQSMGSNFGAYCPPL